MAGVAIPEELKASVPQTFFGKILAVTPVVLAVVATLLAGLASSEMTSAQYDRAFGAQLQSKAGDQWSFFQAKRLRGAYQESTAELLQTLTEVHPLDAAELLRAAGGNEELNQLLKSPAAAKAIGLLQRGEVPAVGAGGAVDGKVKAALEGLGRLAPDEEMAGLLAGVSDGMLEGALKAAREQAEGFDAATVPVNAFVERLSELLPQVAGAGGGTTGRSLARDIAAARLRYTAARYETEARLNQAIANIYELQVRKSNISAERHHARSQQFFYGMLAAQLGVIVATFALAAKKRNVLWILAATVGGVAIAFAGYVYLYT
jgi:hypothetical protein